MGGSTATSRSKCSLAADPRFKERFEREARVVASLNHPHICTLYDIGEHAGATFLVMEYLEGQTLAARLARERVPFETALTWAVQVADALALAHARGVIHRDLKPANLMLVRRGGPAGPRPGDADIKVLDFGLAKIADAATATLAPTMAATDAGVAVGTVAYMSPEQARGEPLDARSDVFSFGAVLYELATGQPAFGGATTAVIFEAILNRPVRSLRDVASDVPLDFAALVDRMLAKRAADRHPDGGAVAAALRELQARRGSSRPGSGAVAARMPSIAVLPFADMSAQKSGVHLRRTERPRRGAGFNRSRTCTARSLAVLARRPAFHLRRPAPRPSVRRPPPPRVRHVAASTADTSGRPREVRWRSRILEP